MYVNFMYVSYLLNLYQEQHIFGLRSRSVSNYLWHESQKLLVQKVCAIKSITQEVRHQMTVQLSSSYSARLIV